MSSIPVDPNIKTNSRIWRLILWLLWAVVVRADERALHSSTDRFGGGMSVQGGFVSADTRHGELSGLILGLGGRLHFYLGRFLRIGLAGARLSMDNDTPGREGSYYTVGYGGGVVEVTMRAARWRLSAGALAGVGNVDHLHVVQTLAKDTVWAVLTYDMTFVAAPMVTTELRISNSISLMLSGDWLFGPGLGQKRHFLGPKLHAGVLFNR